VRYGIVKAIQTPETPVYLEEWDKSIRWVGEQHIRPVEMFKHDDRDASHFSASPPGSSMCHFAMGKHGMSMGERNNSVRLA
jgi:hypothetical protein